MAVLQRSKSGGWFDLPLSGEGDGITLCRVTQGTTLLLVQEAAGQAERRNKNTIRISAARALD